MCTQFLDGEKRLCFSSSSLNPGKLLLSCLPFTQRSPQRSYYHFKLQLGIVKSVNIVIRDCQNSCQGLSKCWLFIHKSFCGSVGLKAFSVLFFLKGYGEKSYQCHFSIEAHFHIFSLVILLQFPAIVMTRKNTNRFISLSDVIEKF